jgi:hypothetical protein
MKTLISIFLLLLSIQIGMAQENTARKEFLFENPVAKERIKIETGNKVVIRFKLPDVNVTGTILSLSDSSLLLGVRTEPYRQFVLFRNIATMTVIAEAKKIYIVRVTLKSGEILNGVLIHATQDSMTVQKNILDLQLTHIAAATIKSIRIHRRRAIGRGIGWGACSGGILGAVIGYASYSPPHCTNAFICVDLGPGPDVIAGGVMGAAAGSLVGLAIGSVNKKFKIEGDQSQFDLFANEFNTK